MEKISEISLEKNGSKIKMISIIVVILIMVGLSVSLFELKFNSYTKLEILPAGDNLYLVSHTALAENITVILDNSSKVNLHLSRINKYIYIALPDKFNREDLNYMHQQGISRGRMLIGQQDLFDILFSK